jgi:outer membrane immunogenic protein
MKRFVLTLTILSAFGALLFAGPEPISSGKEMKQVQPMPPPCPSWTGFYIGVFGGYKHADVDLDTEFTRGLFANNAEGDAVESRLSPDLDTDGAELGGIIGFNYQLHSNWVFGLEAAGGYLWLRDSDVSERFLGPTSGNEYHTSNSFKTNYLFTVAPRFGYAFCRWMPYVTGGLAVGDVELDSNVKRHLGAPVNGGFNDGFDDSETDLGWMVGGGLEYAITNHWKARLQYQYIDLGEADFTRESTEVDFSTGRSEVELREHNVSFALMFGF